MSYQLEAVSLITGFHHYKADKGLPDELFRFPDHIAFHAESIQDFDSRVKEIDPQANLITVKESDNRFIAAAQLVGSIPVSESTRVEWLQIVEPGDEELSIGQINQDYIEFFYQDFSAAKAVLRARKINYSIRAEPYPEITVIYDRDGSEFRITRKPIDEIVTQDLQTGEATLVKLAA